MTPEQKGHLPIQIEKLFYDLQDRIFSDVVRRIRKTGKITSSADYQIHKLEILGNSTEFIEQEIKRLLDASDPEIWELYDKVANWEYVRYRDAYEQINRQFVPLADNDLIQQWGQAIIRQTKGDIVNITQSMGMSVSIGGGKKAFTPLADYYQRYLDRACMDIVTGSFDYNTVLRRVIKEMTDSGIRSVNYASGWNNRVPVAARRAVMTGVSRLSAQINEQIAKDLETDKYEITWHAGHRPSHWWGGRIYTYSELESVCGLGDVAGLCGANCRHSYYAFIEGVSVPNYTAGELRELEEKEAQTHTYKDKEYNAYQAAQAQRQMEAQMRAQRARVKQLQAGGAEQEDINSAKARYLHTLKQYQDFSKKMKIPEQMERVYMDGIGRVAPGKSTYQKTIVKVRQNVILKEKLKEVGLTGKIHTTPSKIDMKSLSFNDAHINDERGHNVTFEEAKSFIQNARFSETVWKGRFERYYSTEGVAYVNKNTLQIRTAYKPDEFTKVVKRVMEVLNSE